MAKADRVLSSWPAGAVGAEGGGCVWTDGNQ